MTMLRVVLFWYSMGFIACMATVTFTNLKCTMFKESYGEFKECRIKAVNRTHKYIDIYLKVLKPLDNLKINFKLMRNDHGYKPFFLDVTVDACKFLKNQNNVFVNLIYEIYKDYSNMNHSCPFDHDLIVEKLWTGNQDDKFTKYLPSLNGDYMVSLTYYVFKEQLTKLEIYVKKTG